MLFPVIITNFIYEFYRSILYDLYSSVHDPELVQIARSCDIVRDNELVGAHRRRSNTAQRLDKLKKERRLQAKIKRVTLRNPHPSERTELCEGKLVTADELFQSVANLDR